MYDVGNVTRTRRWADRSYTAIETRRKNISLNLFKQYVFRLERICFLTRMELFDIGRLCFAAPTRFLRNGKIIEQTSPLFNVE